MAARLTPRDRWLLRMLAEHRVLTTTHLHHLCFPSPRMTQRRLRTLRELGVIDAFQPLTTTGSRPHHWVLTHHGALVLAAEDDITPPSTRYRAHGDHLMIAHSHHLTHLLGVHTSAIHLARTSTDTFGLRAWWSATRCAHAVGDHIRPDAFLRFGPPHPHPTTAGLAAWLEYDTGSESLRQLSSKLLGYHELATTTTTATVIPVLFVFPTPTRAAHATTALAQFSATLPRPDLLPLATTHPDTHPPRWRPLNPHHPTHLPLPALAEHWPHRTNPTHTTHTLRAPHPTPRRGTHPRLHQWATQLTPPPPTPPPA